MDEPSRVTAEDVRGLQVQTGRLATSIENMSARQNATDAAVKDKADTATVDEVKRLAGRANINSLLAVVAVAIAVVAIVAGGLVLKITRDHDQQQTRDRRIAFCHSLDDLGTAVKAGGKGAISTLFDPQFQGPNSNPDLLQKFADAFDANGAKAIDAAVVDTKARNGFSADCTQITNPGG